MQKLSNIDDGQQLMYLTENEGDWGKPGMAKMPSDMYMSMQDDVHRPPSPDYSPYHPPSSGHDSKKKNVYAVYDGDSMEVVASENGNMYYMNIEDDTILNKVLNQPVSEMNLMDRLKMEMEKIKIADDDDSDTEMKDDKKKKTQSRNTNRKKSKGKTAKKKKGGKKQIKGKMGKSRKILKLKIKHHKKSGKIKRKRKNKTIGKK